MKNGKSFYEIFSGTKGVFPSMTDPDGDVVLAGSVTLCRSVENIPFTVNAPREMRISSADGMMSAISKAAKDTKIDFEHVFDLSNLSCDERGVLYERSFISHKAMREPETKRLAVSGDLDFSIALNDMEHIVIRSLARWDAIEKANNTVQTFDDALSNHIPYAFDATLGYLNSTPDLIGTGMKVACLLHLPALFIEGSIKTLRDTASSGGLEIEQFFEGNASSGGALYTVMNRGTLGESENGIFNRIKSVVSRIVIQERLARESIIKAKRDNVCDLVMRAAGLLKYAYLLSERDAFNYLSPIRFGIENGLIAGSTNEMDAMFYRLRTHHLSLECQETSSGDPLKYRAAIVKDILPDKLEICGEEHG